MNPLHLEHLATDEWRATLRERVLPFAFGALTPAALGANVLEVGPGPGLTTDLLSRELDQLTAIEIDRELAAALAARMAGAGAGAAAGAVVEVVEGDATAMPFEDRQFTGAVTFAMFHHVPSADLQDLVLAEIFRVLRPGGLLIANDSVASEELAAFHIDDIYNPVDPATLGDRLRTIGYTDVTVRINPYAWACHARRPPA
ncbi:MAG TPA: class I SAM-dependent methyltransferase [Ilumatobacteraceae bacterium]